MQPSTSVLTAEDLERLAQREFGDSRRDALAALAVYGTEVHHREVVRVRVALLKLSGGNLGALQRLARMACEDYRDLLAWAEYPESLRRPTWNLKPEEVSKITAADSKQYTDWLEGKH